MCTRLFLFRAIVIACAMVVTPAIAAAQRDPFDVPPGPKRVDLSGSGGFMLSTDWSDLVLLGSGSPGGGALEQILVRDLVVNPGPVFDATVTYWEGRYGFRAHGGFASSCLAVGRRCGDLTALTDGSGRVAVKSYTYDIGGAIGLIDYKPGRWAWPYVLFGIGGVTYNLDRRVGPPLTLVERQPTTTAAGPTIVVRDDPDYLLVTIDELGIETKLALNFGVGTDFRIPMGPASLGLRLEISDHLHRSPLAIDVTQLGAFGSQTDVDFGLVHNLRAAAGIVVQFGR